MAYLVVLNITQLLSFQHIITIKLINEIFYILFFWYEVFKIWYASYTYGTFQSSLSIINFKGSITIPWLVATLLGSGV